jgi:hypothetical protein
MKAKLSSRGSTGLSRRQAFAKQTPKALVSGAPNERGKKQNLSPESLRGAVVDGTS